MRGATSVAWQPDLGHPWSYTTQNTDRLTHNEPDKPDCKFWNVSWQSSL